MKSVSILMVVFAGLSAWAPAFAGVTSFASSFEDIVDRQSAGVESALFSVPVPAEARGHSVAVHPVVGFYGSDGILSGVSASYHTSRLVPWDVGVHAGVLDLDIVTWTVAVSSGRTVWNNERSAIVLEGAVGYQFMDEKSGERTAVSLSAGEFGAGTGDDVLLDSFVFVHSMARAVYSIDLWLLRPIVDIGWVGTWYHLDGTEWDGSFPLTDGAPRDESGTTGKITFGLGAGLNVDRAILFGGVRFVDDAGLFQASVGLTF